MANRRRPDQNMPSSTLSSATPAQNNSEDTINADNDAITNADNADNDTTGAIVVGCAYLLTIICLCLVYVRIYGIRKKKLVLKINRHDDNQLLVMRGDGIFVSDESYRMVSKPVFYTPSSLFSVDLNSNHGHAHSSASGTYQSPQSLTEGIHSASTFGLTQIEGVRIGNWVELQNGLLKARVPTESDTSNYSRPSTPTTYEHPPYVPPPEPSKYQQLTSDVTAASAGVDSVNEMLNGLLRPTVVRDCIDTPNSSRPSTPISYYEQPLYDPPREPYIYEQLTVPRSVSAAGQRWRNSI